MSKSLIIESVIQIHERQNPNILAELLEVYLSDKERADKSNGGEAAVSGGKAGQVAAAGAA